MLDHGPAVRAFFDAYAQRMNDALADPPTFDVKGTRSAFSDYFVGTDPRTVRGGKNGIVFGLVTRLGYRRYRKLGCKRMELKRLDVTRLDDFHALASTGWSSLFRRKDKSMVEIEFDNLYLLHLPAGGTPRIFAWITGDERQALRDHGIG